MTISPRRETTGGPAPHAARTLVLLSLISFVSLVDRMQIPTLLQPIKAEFRLNDSQLGLLSGAAFGLTYAAATLPLAWLADRYSRRRLLAAALAFWALMTAASGTARTFGHLILSRVGVAAGEASFTPTAHSVLADIYPPSRLGWAIGLETSGGTLGIMAGMSLAGLVAGELGWRAAMVVASVPALLMAVVVIMFLPDPPRKRVPSVPRMVGRAATFNWFGGRYVGLVVLAILNSVMSTGWAQWMPSFFQRSHGLAIGQVGPAVGIATGLGLLFGSIAGGYASAVTARRSPRAPHLFCATVCALVAPSFALTLWLPSVTLALLLTAVSACLVGMLAPFIFADIQAICPPGSRARAVAVAMTLVTIGSYAVMPPLVGALSDLLRPQLGADSLRGALAFIILAPVAGSSIFLWLSGATRFGSAVQPGRTTPQLLPIPHPEPASAHELVEKAAPGGTPSSAGRAGPLQRQRMNHAGGAM